MKKYYGCSNQNLVIPTGNKYRLRWPRLVFILLLTTMLAGALTAKAQQPNQWPSQQQIPGFHPETSPPIMLVDQNHTVHAFSSQWLGEDEGDPVKAIVYNQWTLEQGWTPPVDILLSPLKSQARLTGAFLDQSGIMHVAFFGGDNTEANIYYSKVPAVNAGHPKAWSTPIVIDEANDPEVAALVGDDQGNLAIVYSGEQAGWGLYTVYSADGGDTWTEPDPTFLTYGALFPVTLELSPSQSGSIHAVWDVRNTAGQGRQINYARLNLADRQWSEPVVLAEVDSGYGVLFPTVVEYRGEVIVAYSGVTIRRSSDGGRTWTAPVAPFRHVGVNGTMSFVVDSNDDLHFFWPQRVNVTGGSPIHGVWHSQWQAGHWPEPEAVVSGPGFADLVGDKSFDPYNVRALVSQGNAILVTWRTDPGAKGNGVWYSYLQLDAPELPVVAIPTIPVATSTPELTATTTPPSDDPAPTATPEPILKDIDVESSSGFLANNPAGPVVIGVVPVILLISIIVVRSFIIQQSRR